jgi:N-acetylmuramoyl-L-alanine amidase
MSSLLPSPRTHPASLAALLAALAFALLLTSCESPSEFLTNPSNSSSSFGGSSSGLDEWGNRPGPRGFRTVVVDAGHGGMDSGARSRRTGLTEKTLTLDTAQRLARQLSGSFHVVMSRDSDVFVGLDDRVDIANRHGDGILVSIHYNESGSGVAGPETYWWRVDSYTLAMRVQRNLSAMADQHHSRGLVRRRLHLTRNPEIPCILVEGGYISNSREGACLSDSSYREKIARAIASAIREQAAVGDGDLGPLPPFIKAPLSHHGDARDRR